MNKIKSLILVVAVALSGYSALWYSQAMNVKSKVATSIERMNAKEDQHWNIQYSDIHMCGFPFSIAAKLENPTIQNHVSSQLIANGFSQIDEMPAFEWIHNGTVTIGKTLLGDQLWFETTGTCQLALEVRKEPIKIAIPMHLEVISGHNFDFEDLSFENLIKDFTKLHFKLDQGFVDEYVSLDGFDITVQNIAPDSDNLNYHYDFNLSNLEITSQIETDADDTFEGVLIKASSLFQVAPEKFGKINLDFSGDISLPSMDKIEELTALMEEKPLEGLKEFLQTEWRISLDQKGFSHALGSGTTALIEFGITPNHEDETATIFLTGNGETNVHVAAHIAALKEQYQYLLDHGKEAPTQTDEMAKVKEFIFANAEALNPAHLEPYIPSIVGIDERFQLEFDLSQNQPKLNSFDTVIKMDLPSFDREFSFDSTLTFNGGWDLKNAKTMDLRPKCRIHMTNFDPLLKTCFDAWNSCITMYASVEPTAAEGILPEEALAAAHYLLSQLNENKEEGTNDLLIHIDFTNPENPKVGALPYDQLQQVLATAAMAMQPAPPVNTPIPTQ